MSALISSAVTGRGLGAKAPKAVVRRRIATPNLAVKARDAPPPEEAPEPAPEPESWDDTPRTTQPPPSPPAAQLEQPTVGADDVQPTEAKRETSPALDLPLDFIEPNTEPIKVDSDAVADSADGYPFPPIVSAPSGLESVASLVRRLQNNICAEPVKILVSRDMSIEPAVVEETALCVVSKIFSRDFSKTWDFARFFEAEEEDRQYSFFDYPPVVVETFLYWLVNRSVPTQAACRSESVATGADYQMLMVKTYAFAEDKRIKEMMNDVMPVLLETLADTKLDQHILQNILRCAGRESMLRMAVLEEALKIKNEDGAHMVDGLDRRWLVGIDADITMATARFSGRGGCRGATPAYLVELDPIPPPQQQSRKRERSPSPFRFGTLEPDFEPRSDMHMQPGVHERDDNELANHVHPQRTHNFSPPRETDYLRVKHPTICVCPFLDKWRKVYPKVNGEEVARSCWKCGRYKKAIIGKKFAWRHYTGRWMWVPLNAVDGYGPADGDETDGWVET
ncbi:hypothetical protein LTR53_015957 [Teratosphaeriaceae sp. CCFEE 6253]|nr:hypothetical protein LTR53_015957 [Teratosphaeriaceae sp. CCFEE 6253]